MSAQDIEFGLDSFVPISVDESGQELSGDVVIRNTVEEAVLADAVGIDSFNIGEHYRPELMDSAGHVIAVHNLIQRNLGVNDREVSALPSCALLVLSGLSLWKLAENPCLRAEVRGLADEYQLGRRISGLPRDARSQG